MYASNNTINHCPLPLVTGIFCLYSSTILYSVYLFMLKYFVEIYKICYQINQVISLPISIIFHVFVKCFICNNISQIVFPIKVLFYLITSFVVRIVASVQIIKEGLRRYDNFNTMIPVIIICSHEPAVITSKEKTKQY